MNLQVKSIEITHANVHTLILTHTHTITRIQMSAYILVYVCIYEYMSSVAKNEVSAGVQRIK